MRPLVIFTRDRRGTAPYSRPARCWEGRLVHNLWKRPRTTEKSVCRYGRHARSSTISTGISPLAFSSQIYAHWWGAAKRTFRAPLRAHSDTPPTPLWSGAVSNWLPSTCCRPTCPRAILRSDADSQIRRICASNFEWSLDKLRPPGDARKGRKTRTWPRFQSRYRKTLAPATTRRPHRVSVGRSARKPAIRPQRQFYHERAAPRLRVVPERRPSIPRERASARRA